MVIERRSFKIGLVAGLFLFFGVIAGVALTLRMDWMTPVESKSDADVPALNHTVTDPPKNHFVPIVKAASPAVVNISTTRIIKPKKGQVPSPFSDDPFFKHFFGDEFSRRFNSPRKRQENALGSGVIVDPNGYIITNNHVVAKADKIKVVLSDEREFDGEVIGTDPKTDLAVIKIKAKNLPALAWGNSDQLEVGEYVLAIGNPFGLSQTITMGIVSAVGRANVGIADYEDFIQTDAAINPGNSGGALVNVKGELIGINTAIFSRSGGYMGIGFAVPSNMAKAVMNSLVKTGKVTRGWLGVSIQKVTKELAKQFDLPEAKGALIGEVMDNTPAEKAGIEAGDVIIRFNNQDVDSPTTLRNIVAATEVGKKVKVVVIRDSKKKTLTVKTGEQPKDLAKARMGDSNNETSSSVLAGLEVRGVTPSIARELGIKGTAGVVVSSVEPGSSAQQAGVRQGDVIIGINRKAVNSVADFRAITNKINKKENILLRIKRRGGKVFIIIKPQS